MTTVRMGHTRLLPESLLEYADVEIGDTLRLLLEEARKKGPFTLADIKSLKLEIDDYSDFDDRFPKGTLRVQFRMDKEVAQ